MQLLVRGTAGIALALVLSAALPAAAAPTGVRTGRVDELMPAAEEGHIAWVENTRRRPGRRIVFAKPDGAPRFRVSGRGRAYWPGIDDGTLVYQQTSRRASSIKLVDLASRQRTDPPPGVNTRRWEYFPDLSGDWLLYAQAWNEDRDRRVLLFNLATRERRVLDATSGARKLLTPGQVNGGYAVWSKARNVNGRTGTVGSCDVFLYDISAATRTRIPNPRPCQYAPSVTARGTVYYGQSGRSCGSRVRLLSYPPGGPASVEVAFPQGIDVLRTYLFTQASRTHVYFDRARCAREPGQNAFDIYRFIDR